MSAARSKTGFRQTQLDLLQPPVRGLILDMDGVLWKDAEQIGDLAAVFRAIQDRGLRVTLATNNAMKTVDDYRLMLSGFGVDLVSRQILTSGEATADALAAALPQRAAVFVIGERGVIQALESRGFQVITDPEVAGSVAAVVAGLDRGFTYPQLNRAAALIRGGALFYGTNPDTTFPTPGGLVPGAGSILAAVAAASDRQPVVIGKPSPMLFEIASARLDLRAESLLVVGDRLETDVAGGQAFGARTALVLSGVSTAEQARAWTPPPTLVAPSLSGLVGV